MKKVFFVILMLGTFSVLAQNAESKLASLLNEKNEATLQQKISDLKNGTAEDLLVLVQYNGKDTVKRSEITKILSTKYPQSDETSMAIVMSFIDIEGGPEETEAHFKSISNEYSDVNMDMARNIVAMSYAEVPNGTKVMEYINSIEDPVYRVAAITMNIELMVPIDIDQALDIATKHLKDAEKLKSEPALYKPLKLDPIFTYNNYINMYGKLLFKAGENKEAYKYTKEAYQNIENKDGELILNYAFLSSLLDGNYEEALPVLINAIKEGQNEKRYIDQVRVGYQKLNPGKDVDAFVASLQEGFKNKIQDLVKPLMVNEPAPNFYMTDVNGKKVTLADFKGKTIVLDFWATWCGPCVASFPAMQMVVDHYSDDPDVKVLFIDTWENVADPLTTAKEFLSKRNYDFDLFIDAIDPDNMTPPALTAFKAEAIPAKFIIDDKSRIRFKLEGFEGKDEVAAEEVIQMIELARRAE